MRTDGSPLEMKVESDILALKVKSNNFLILHIKVPFSITKRDCNWFLYSSGRNPFPSSGIAGISNVTIRKHESRHV